jgi:prepilin-type N-terminal cleavage/methylation domain-containing protein
MRLSGYSLIETMIVLAILLTLAGMAMPSVLGARDDARARSAVEYIASLVHLAHLEAIKRHVNVALRFEPDATDFRFGMYADGNGNGVRTADIDAGVDRRVRPLERIGQQCPGVRFALDDRVSAIDASASDTREPIRLGPSRMISFSPMGASSSGTVYLLGRGSRQFAVRVLGPTGRVRMFEYHFGVAEWRAR